MLGMSGKLHLFELGSLKYDTPSLEFQFQEPEHWQKVQ